MISWSAYAPRRARDPIAWLAAKRIVTPEGLSEALLALGIDPQTFPHDIAETYLGSLGCTTVDVPSVCQATALEVEGALVDTAQAVVKRASRRFGRSTPT